MDSEGYIDVEKPKLINVMLHSVIYAWIEKDMGWISIYLIKEKDNLSSYDYCKKISTSCIS